MKSALDERMRVVPYSRGEDSTEELFSFVPQKLLAPTFGHSGESPTTGSFSSLVTGEQHKLRFTNVSPTNTDTEAELPETPTSYGGAGDNSSVGTHRASESELNFDAPPRARRLSIDDRKLPTLPPTPQPDDRGARQRLIAHDSLVLSGPGKAPLADISSNRTLLFGKNGHAYSEVLPEGRQNILSDASSFSPSKKASTQSELVAPRTVAQSSFVAPGTLRNLYLPPIDKHVIVRRRLPDRSAQSRRAPAPAKAKPVSLVGVRFDPVNKPSQVQEPVRSHELMLEKKASPKPKLVISYQKSSEDASTVGSAAQQGASVSDEFMEGSAATAALDVEKDWSELSRMLKWAMETKTEILKEHKSAQSDLHDGLDELTELLIKFRKIFLAFTSCVKKLSQHGELKQLTDDLLSAITKRQALLLQSLDKNIKSKLPRAGLSSELRATRGGTQSRGFQECPFNVVQSSEGVRWLVERYLLGDLDERLTDVYLFIGALAVNVDSDSVVVREIGPLLKSNAKLQSELILRKQIDRCLSAFLMECAEQKPENHTDEYVDGLPTVDQMYGLAERLYQASDVAADKVLAALAGVCQSGSNVKDVEGMLTNAEALLMETTSKMLQILDLNPDFQPAECPVLSTTL